LTTSTTSIGAPLHENRVGVGSPQWPGEHSTRIANFGLLEL
jgi:hypothetical protein